MNMNEVVEIYFEKLNEEEKHFIHEVPILAAILVAGADDNIDKMERKVAEKITYIKSYTTEELKEFYKEVSAGFHDKFESILSRYPKTASERNPLIREDLKRVEEILPKMLRTRADEFVNSVKEIARYVAEASGGIVGYYSIRATEKNALYNLNLIVK